MGDNTTVVRYCTQWLECFLEGNIDEVECWMDFGSADGIEWGLMGHWVGPRDRRN